MDLTFTEDQRALRDSFAGFFAKVSNPGVVRAAEPLGFDDKVWDQLVGTGAPTMALSSERGGGGAGALDVVIVAQELGRRLAPVPLVEAVVSANALVAADCPAELLEGVLDGSVIVTTGLTRARNGVARLLPGGAIADMAVVLDGDELVALRRMIGPRPRLPSPSNLGCSPIASWPTSGSEIERHVLVKGSRAVQVHRHAQVEWQLYMAAALDGLRSEALAIGIDYVKSRVAFGMPIGTFQAIQHRLADVATAGEGAQLLLYEAAWASDSSTRDADQLAAMAFLYQALIAQQTTRESLQFHGGYGFTLEYDIQLYFRRAKAWPLAMGDPSLGFRALAVDLFTSEE